MPFSKFLNAHPSGHKARGYAFLSLSNMGFDFSTTPLLFNSINEFLLKNLKIKKIFLWQTNILLIKIIVIIFKIFINNNFEKLNYYVVILVFYLPLLENEVIIKNAPITARTIFGNHIAKKAGTVLFPAIISAAVISK